MQLGFMQFLWLLLAKYILSLLCEVSGTIEVSNTITAGNFSFITPFNASVLSVP